MKSLSRILLCLVLMLAVPVQANQQGTIVRQATVYADASVTAPRVGKIDAGVQVTIFGRKGGWQEIFSEQRSITGWVRVFEVRQGDFGSTVTSGEKEDKRGFLSGLATFSRKASGFFTQDSAVTSSSTATIGVRGLSESEINSAQADFDELQKMNQFASNRQRAAGFAAAGRLQARKIAQIPGHKQ
jgi:uncharacterized protein YraI